MSITSRITLPALASLALLGAALPAYATTVTECQAAVTVVRGDLAGVVILGSNPDLTRASLVSKLDGANLKLDEGKFSDALTKLTDFSSKISSLQTQGKLADGVTTISQLQLDTAAAISCVQSLLNQ
jgi:hypothetical protein